MLPLASGPEEPSYVSHQVTDARRYYLDLTPSRRIPLAIICGGVERMLPEYVVTRTDFPHLAVELVVEGEGTLFLNSRKYRLAPGVLFAYGPGVAHSILNNPRHRMRKYYVDFSGREGLKLLNAAGLGSWRALQVSAVHEFMELFENLDREARNEGPLAREVCASIARTLLLKIRQRTVSRGSRIPRSFTTYERIRSHVEKHCERLLSVEDIARECHLTPVYVSRLFRRFGRTGAYHFLLRLKMNRAADLIRDEGLLVKEAGERLGFADAFQFSRAFKRVLGAPPTHLRTQ
jgi:AraC-like DNA-binding protein